MYLEDVLEDNKNTIQYHITFAGQRTEAPEDRKVPLACNVSKSLAKGLSARICGAKMAAIEWVRQKSV